jgi:TetR/AcrR family transcriptional repressor of nem operon
MNIKHDRELVLQKGIKLFSENGYTKLGIDEICQQTGMTKGAFYNAFKSKEQFLQQVIELYSSNNVKRIQKKLALTSTNEKAIDKIAQFYLDMLAIQPNINHIGCLVNNMMAELGSINPTISALTTIEYNSFIQAIIPTIVAAQEAGDLTNLLSAKELTELLHATFYGLLTISKSNQDSLKSMATFRLLINNLKIKK